MTTRSVIIDANQPELATYVQCDGREVGAELRRIILDTGRDETLRALRNYSHWYAIHSKPADEYLKYLNQSDFHPEPGVGVAFAAQRDHQALTEWRDSSWCEYEHTVLLDGHVITRSWAGWRKCYDSRVSADRVPASYISIAYRTTTWTAAERIEQYMHAFYPSAV